MSEPVPAPVSTDQVTVAGDDADPSTIVDQIQTLTDIEGDLAETALAVMEQDVTQSQTEEATQPVQVAGSSHSSAGEAEQTLMDTAEATEAVLENAIPAAPGSPAASDTESEETEEIEPDVSTQMAEEQGVSASTEPAVPDLPGDPAAEATEVLHVVEADTEPILAEVTASVTETEGPAQMDTVSEAQPAPELATQQNGHVTDPQPAPQASHPQQLAPPPAQSESDKAQESEIVLPQGLTWESPSVRANRDLVQSLQTDHRDPTLLLSLFNWAVQKTEIVDARAWYSALAENDATAVQPLLALINLELALSNFPQVETLFASALKGPSGGITAAADVSIWKAYLHYIRRQNPINDSAPNAETVRATVTKAYEFALKECGFDRESGEIWDEYIRFVADTPSKNQWETQAQQDTLRKLYTRAVCIPLNNLEALWKSYDTFESAVNKATAKKFLAERSPAYMTARTALRELRALTDGLPQPILPPRPTFSDSDRGMVAGWRAYLKWEEGNPLVIEDEETLQARIAYALRKCLAEMRHFPELWHYAATYYTKKDNKEAAVEVLQAGVKACPKSFLLTFALSELLEDLHNFGTVHELFVSLIDTLTPEVESLNKTIALEVEAAKGPEIPNADTLGDINMDGDGVSDVQKMVEERENRGKLVAERRGVEVEQLIRGINIAWVMYMRFARRAEGIKAARGVFGKARKSPHLSWHIFEASAMMEYHSNKDSAVAIRIFELGLKLFSEDADYVIKYLQFLLSVNDDTNARALFERSAIRIPASKARPLWDTWARYEYLYGDLSAVHKLEARFVEAFPNDSPLKRFAQRYAYNGVDQIALRDLGFGAVRPAVIVPNPTLVSASAPAAPAPLPVPAAGSSTGAPPSPGGYKRPAPESPRRAMGHERGGSIDASRSPKRYRTQAHSPPPPPRRYPDREVSGPGPGPGPRDRGGSGRFSQPPGPGPMGGRDRSPMVLPPPPPGGRNDRPPYGGAPAPMSGPPGPGPSGSAGGMMDRDRSGLGKPLVWFIGNLPSARSFDGPTFRADDIMGLFSNINANGMGMPPPIPMGGGPPGRGGYPEPDRRYGGPPPMHGRY
ncbi:hypothetical protein IAU60_002248 [Kwoniella sp. DSM 27419]